VPAHDLVGLAAGDRHPPRGQVVEEQSQAVQVDPRIELAAHDRLGRDVREGARQPPDLRAAPGGLREPEVGQLDPAEPPSAGSDQDVRGFQVAVDEAGLVHVPQALEHPPGELLEGRGAARSRAQGLVGRAAGEVLEDQVGRPRSHGTPPGTAQTVRPQDVGMPQACPDRELLREGVRGSGGLHPVEHLQRDHPVLESIERPVHGAHAAASKGLEEQEPAVLERSPGRRLHDPGPRGSSAPYLHGRRRI
jgi:hypothetical protein